MIILRIERFLKKNKSLNGIKAAYGSLRFATLWKNLKYTKFIRHWVLLIFFGPGPRKVESRESLIRLEIKGKEENIEEKQVQEKYKKIHKQ